MTIHLTDLSDLIPYEVALTGLFAAITGRTITASLTADDMRLAIEQKFAALEALREVCDGVPLMIEDMTERLSFTMEGEEAIEWENRRYRAAHNIRLALKHALSHAPDASQAALL